MTDFDLIRALHRTRHALTIVPDLVEHISSLRGVQGRSNGPRVQTTKLPPTPLNLGAVDDADYAYRALAYWTSVFAGHLGTEGPATLRGSRRLADGTLDGFPHDVSSELARAVIRRLSVWMSEHLDAIASRAPADLAEFQPDVDAILDLRATWPMEDASAYAGFPCPHHGERIGLCIYPPIERLQHRVIVCDHGHYFTEDEFRLAGQQYAAGMQQRLHQARRDQADRERGERTMGHLMKRYGERHAPT